MTRKVLFIALCALALVACKKASDEGLDLSKAVVTGDVINLTSTSATVTVFYNPIANMKIDKKYVYFSTASNPEEGDKHWSNRYDDPETGANCFVFTGLQPGTTYYYQGYMYYDMGVLSNAKAYGEVKSFTTPVSD